jgi:hypothetical protein
MPVPMSPGMKTCGIIGQWRTGWKHEDLYLREVLGIEPGLQDCDVDVLVIGETTRDG